MKRNCKILDVITPFQDWIVHKTLQGIYGVNIIANMKQDYIKLLREIKEKNKQIIINFPRFP